MKRVEKLAQNWLDGLSALEDQYLGKDDAFEAGYRQALEDAANIIDPGMDSRYLGDLVDDIRALADREE